jgi:hypothetical protein
MSKDKFLRMPSILISEWYKGRGGGRISVKKNLAGFVSFEV